MIVGGAKPGDEARGRPARPDEQARALIGTDAAHAPVEEKAAAGAGVRAPDACRCSRPADRAAIVDRVFPLDDAADAFDDVREPGKLGKVLLELPG